MTREEIIAEVRRLGALGLTGRDIALAVGVGRSTVRRWLTPEKTAARMTAKGYTPDTIATSVGWSESQIEEWKRGRRT